MEKIIWIVIIAMFNFGCVKKDNYIIEKTNVSVEIVSNEVETVSNVNIITFEESNKPNYSIELLLDEYRKIISIRENIANDYLFEDLNLHLRYDTIEKILLKFNINEKPKEEIEYSQNRHYPDVIDYFYYFETENIKFELFKNEFFTEYRIIAFEIIINEDNYLELFNNFFPYLSFDYFSWTLDENIKRINIEDKTIRYFTDDMDVWGFNSCSLIFDSNGLIKSFRTQWGLS